MTTAAASGSVSPVRSADPHAAERHETRLAFGLAIGCGVFGLAGYLAQHGGLATVEVSLALLAYLLGGLRTLYDAAVALRRGVLEINFLMILAAVVSAILGHWADGALLLFLFSFSHALEHYAVERTRRGISALMELRPTTARRIRDGAEEIVPIEQLSPGQEIRVRPGERLPIDGDIVEGEAALDESIVTGESLPVDKGPGAPVFAGTINTNGSLRVRMSRPAGESTIARIVRMVESAQDNKIAAQRVIESWQSPYVGSVLAMSVAAVFLAWAASGDLIDAVKRAMVLLVAASPCAVVLASPVAVLAAVTRAARFGILFKGGAHLGRLAAVEVIAFDKTGTITHGKPRVDQIETLGGLAENDLLALAAAIEAHSEHPLAAAIVAEARGRGLVWPELSEFENHAGLGVAGRVQGEWLAVGKRRLFDKINLPIPPELARLAAAPHLGSTVIVCDQRGRSGLITLADTVRPDSAAAIAALRRMDIRTMHILTGDRREIAEAIGREVGVLSVFAELAPGEKLERVHRIAEKTSIAMVGDGVNDAPALAAATVGVAMGAAGSDVALETADVVLMRDRLTDLVTALTLARRCRQTIRTSLCFAFAVIALLIVLTFSASLPLPLAVVGHEGSTVIVILNGLRLLLFTPQPVDAGWSAKSASQIAKSV